MINYYFTLMLARAKNRMEKKRKKKKRQSKSNEPYAQHIRPRPSGHLVAVCLAHVQPSIRWKLCTNKRQNKNRTDKHTTQNTDCWKWSASDQNYMKFFNSINEIAWNCLTVPFFSLQFNSTRNSTFVFQGQPIYQ